MYHPNGKLTLSEDGIAHQGHGYHGIHSQKLESCCRTDEWVLAQVFVSAVSLFTAAGCAIINGPKL